METQIQETRRNKLLIATAFEKWALGEGNFFDLLDEDMSWTISGSMPYSKRYEGKQQFMNEVIIPLNERFSKKIVPKIRGIYGDGDMVIALWDGIATATDGKPYRSSYSWYMKIKDNKIIEVVAFLDVTEFTDIMRRIRL